jgi:hypothetical protein
MTAESEEPTYHELCAWSLSRRDAGFVHQFVVDCWALQHATERTKPIGMVFPLITLCLHLEHGYTGRQAQLAHMKLAKQRKDWPKLVPPHDRGSVTVEDAYGAQGDAARDAAIERWCQSEWARWKESQQSIRDLVSQELNVP